MSLKDQVVLVTGGSRGIGFAIAQAFEKSGAKVVICARDAAKAQQVAEKSGFAQSYGADVANFEQVDGMIKDIVEKFGRLDVLVNNAGITKDNLLLRMSPDDFMSVIHTNLGSVFNTTKSALKPMLKQKYGRIINISSVVGLMGNPGQANYAAAKAGIHGFTKSIAKEIGAKGITVNAIAPGFIQTDMIESLPTTYLDNIMAGIPARRLGTPEDITGVVTFLASQGAAYITGQVIQVDGGILM